MASVIEKLEGARDRLEATTNAAHEVESKARNLLEFLQTEVADWTAAMENEKAFVQSTSAALKERWSKLSVRVDAVRTHAEEAWTAARNAADNGWKLFEGAWREVEPQFEDLRQEGVVFGTLVESTSGAFRDLDQHHQAATASAIQFIDADVIARAESLANGVQSRSESVSQAVQGEIESARTTVADAGASLTSEQQSAARQLSELTTSFCSKLEESVRNFETRLRENADALKTAAENTQQALTEAGQNIGDTAATLMQGADDVSDTLNTTNVGLSTVVGIVNTGIQICEEIIDEWES